MLGANLILQRLMIQRHMPQKVTLLALDSSSELSGNIYVNIRLSFSMTMTLLYFK